MRRIVIDMQNFLFSDAVKQTLVNFDSDFEIHTSDRPEKTAELCCAVHPYALIMEVTGYMPWRIYERLKIRDEVLKHNPGCKIALVVDEHTEKKLADRVRQAKKDGLIDNFIYSSVSATYLSAVIDTL